MTPHSTYARPDEPQHGCFFVDSALILRDHFVGNVESSEKRLTYHGIRGILNTEAKDKALRGTTKTGGYKNETDRGNAKKGIWVKDENIAEMTGTSIENAEWEFFANLYYDEQHDMLMACGECVCRPVYGKTWKL